MVVASASNSGRGLLGGLFAIVVVALVFAAYWAPTIIAALRKVPNVGSVAVINLLLGWTFIGWAVALAMACRSTVSSTQVNVYQQGGPGWQVHQPQPRFGPTDTITEVGVAPKWTAAWRPDPGGRHELRYWDGGHWTDHVVDRGQQAISPLSR